MHIIVGLGNPGPEYVDTRHNVGYMVIDRISDVYRLKLNKTGRSGIWGAGKIKSHEVVLLKPITFMNNSGVAVREQLNALQKCEPELIVIYDDIDLELGRIRIRQDGGSGGHRGIQSIIDHLNSDEFIRVRVGIGRPPGRQDAAEFVLNPFKRHESEEIEFAIVRAADAVEYILENGIEKAMNEFNRSNSECDQK